jgi:hypothetical protein
MVSRRRGVPAFLCCLVLLVAGCGNGGEGTSGAANVVMDDTITSDRCVVTFGYAGERDVDIVDIRIHYTDVIGDFGPALYEARCRGLVDAATRVTTFNTCEDSCAQGEERSLFLSLSMGQSSDDVVLRTPASMFECYFEGDGATLERLTGEMWLSDRAPSNEAVASFDASIECDGWPSTTTTTSSSTTSTLPCDGGPCEPGAVLPLEFWLDDDVEMGSLQITVTFPAMAGEFDRNQTPSSMNCTPDPAVNGLYATNQDIATEGVTTLDARLAWVFVPSLSGPHRLLTCDFVVGDESPARDDFSITVIDASDPSGQLVEPAPGVSIRGFPAAD